jgi:hypothetical protein
MVTKSNGAQGDEGKILSFLIRPALCVHDNQWWSQDGREKSSYQETKEHVNYNLSLKREEKQRREGRGKKRKGGWKEGKS